MHKQFGFREHRDMPPRRICGMGSRNKRRYFASCQNSWMSISPCDRLGHLTSKNWGRIMMTDDTKMRSPAGFWRDVPIVIGASSSDIGRAQLLYVWLRLTGMDEMNEIRGMW